MGRLKRVQNQPSYTVINTTRVVFSAILVYTASVWEINDLRLVLITGLIAALLWLFATETVFAESRYPPAAYLPTTLDLLIITIFIYFSGTASSLLSAGYVFSVSLCSMNTQIRQGLYAAVASVVCYVGIILLVFLEALPAINVFGGAAEVTVANMMFAFFFIPLTILITHLIVHGLVRQNERLIAEARAAGEAKMEFLANMSHEIRTPLNAILGVADLLGESRLNAEQKKLVRVFRKSGRLLLQIVNDILDFAKIEARELRLQDAPFDPVQLLDDICETYRLTADEKGLEFRRSLQLFDEAGRSLAVDDLNRPRIQCFGDAGRLNQILGNLVGNAIKFTDAGSVEISLQMRVHASAGEAALRFSVRDTGVGIAPNNLALLFDRFVQLDRSGGPEKQKSRTVSGTGLGLAISQELALLMGGEIQANSTPGAGSEFSVLLEFTTLDMSAGSPGASGEAGGGLRDAERAVSGPAAQSAGKRLLIVEDAEENRFLLQHYLKNSPHQLRFAENGAEAVEAFENEEFDLIFMDLQMPVLDGYGAIRRIREIEAARRHEALMGAAAFRASALEAPRPVPIIALTAHAMRQDANRAREAGCNHYLTKPIDKTTFLRAVATYKSLD